MRSLLHDLHKPAVVDLLDTIDSTMNSNTMLFKVEADKPFAANNPQAVLDTFLHSSLFTEMFLEIAATRQLYIIVNDVGEGRRVLRSPTGGFLTVYSELTFASMSEATFAQRLNWMLTTAFSPYETQVSKQHAQEVIGGFFREVFAPQSWPLEQTRANRYWSESPWSFYDVSPNFLYMTGYFNAPDGYEPPNFAYFDGEESDTCTFFYKNEIFYLLLTNGSP